MDNKITETGDVLKALMGRGAECPMCHHNDFQIVDGFISNYIQKSTDGFQLGGPAIPCVAIVCTHCGFVSQHALGVLNAAKSEQSKE